jgi:hypothetical protein
MPRVVPSQIVEAIETLFPRWNELDSDIIGHVFQSDVRTLLGLLEQLPSDLIALPFRHYLEYERCRLATALQAWSLGGTRPARSVLGKNAVERIRRLMMQCHDELPPPEPEFPFVTDSDTQSRIEERVRAAWINFQAREWIGATTSAAVALEATLLWEVKRLMASVVSDPDNQKSGKAPDDMALADLIATAFSQKSISEDTAKQAHLARDARNLIHPGKMARSGTSCNKSTALAAFAAIYRVADELTRAFARRDP